MSVDNYIGLFFSLLDGEEVQYFLKNDGCNVLADKYILASVFVYFLRAKLTEDEYNLRNFFLALYLCHEICEEIDEYKDEIVDYYLNIRRLFPPSTNQHFQKFMEDRFLFLKRMCYKGHIHRKLCEKLFILFPHVVWNRTRPLQHGGAHRCLPSCKQCL
ncbi:speedy protein A-like [Agrilus planipennis]|uniref:Speedy protein A-like n=1 Tax=Agrilus planipennis TaxID=224129 RepID=A0A1W4X5R7_AGRPL|nr:speedy protein A-like [Agrilus planipennis]